MLTLKLLFFNVDTLILTVVLLWALRFLPTVPLLGGVKQVSEWRTGNVAQTGQLIKF